MSLEFEIKASNFLFYINGSILYIKTKLTKKFCFFIWITSIFFLTAVSNSGKYRYLFDNSTNTISYIIGVLIFTIFAVYAYFKGGIVRSLHKQKNEKNLIVLKEINENRTKKIILKNGHFFCDVICNDRSCNHFLGDCNLKNIRKNRFQLDIRYFDTNNVYKTYLKSRITYGVFIIDIRKVFSLIKKYPIFLTERAKFHCDIENIPLPENTVVLEDEDYLQFKDLYDFEQYSLIYDAKLNCK